MKVKILYLSILFTVISGLTLTVGISNPFTTTGEAREALVAQSMFIDNDFLQSVRYADDVATKPPFFHWCIFLLSQFTGNVTEAIARTPSITFAIIALIAWFIFIYVNLGKKTAILTFFILLTAPEWYRHACLARIDMTLAMFITLSHITLYPWLTKKTKFPILSLIPLTLGTLTKGPIAIILPLGSTFLTFLFTKSLTIKKTLSLGIIAIISTLCWGLWLILQMDTEGRNLINVMINENFSRFFDTMNTGDDPHTKNIFYLIGAFIAGFTPWSVFAFFEVKNLIKNKKSYISSEYKPFITWCLISISFCICFFMIPEGKRSVYLLPIYPFSATLFAIICQKLEERKPILVRNIISFIGWVFSLLLIIVVILKYNLINIYTFSNYKALEKFIFNISLFQSKNFTFSKFIIFILPVVFNYFLITKQKERKNYFLRFALLFIVFFSYAKTMIINKASFSLSAKPFIKRSLNSINPNKLSENIYMLTPRMYPIVFYIREYNKNLKVFDYDKDSTNKNQFIFLWKSDENLLENKNNYKITTSKKDISKKGRFLEFAKLKENI